MLGAIVAVAIVILTLRYRSVVTKQFRADLKAKAVSDLRHGVDSQSPYVSFE